MSKIVVDDRIDIFNIKNKRNLSKALGRMSLDIKQISQQYVPLKSGDLHESAEIVINNMLSYTVWYGRYGDTGEYAAVQHKGHREGTGQFQKYTTPSTGPDFLSNAGTKVAMNFVQYIRQASNL